MPGATPWKAFHGRIGSIESPSLPPWQQHAEREDQDHGELAEERDAEHLGRDLDVEVARGSTQQRTAKSAM